MSLENLRGIRREWIEANRKNGFEDGIKGLLTDLYPDNAHFIYELLQNAEDTGASVVRFTLTDTEVEFEHDGKRLFSSKDVESITSIGTSTKKDDTTSIGKFGVGFKAVFAYTNTPEIHSGDFHFRIHDLVVPETDSVPRPKMGVRETRFVFPFDNPKKTKRQAAEEVERGLSALGDNTLLFLTHIRTIEYLLPDGDLGSLERVDHEGGRIEIRTRHPGGEDTVSHWLRFQKDVDVIDEDGKATTCRIAIAYSLVKKNDKKKRHPDWEIVPLDRGQVSIYFPAEKESSNLRFHIHAPFASTVARDSVRDCKANNELRDHLVDLAVESLAAIRDQGMLTVGFLAVLPNVQDNLPKFYEPMREAVVRAFRDTLLTPTKSGTHAPAAALYQGPAAISNILNDNDLSRLTNQAPPLWAANPPQQNQREDRFLDSLKIDSWGWSELTNELSALDEDDRKPVEDWIAEKDDAWVMRFYALLGEACELHDESVDAEDLRIVRVEASEGHEHVSPLEAFLLPDQETTPPRDIRFVKPTVYSSGRSEAQKKFAVSFLEHIGVRPFDAHTVIELTLGHYDEMPDQVGDSHYEDLKQFINYWKKNPADANLFKRHSFILGQSEDGALYWCKPAQLCIDSPYLNTGLADLVGIHKKRVLWIAYKDKLNEPQFTDFIDFLQAVGVMYGVSVSPAPLSSNPKAQDLWEGLYGTKETYTGISEDYSINALENYTKLRSVSASRLVWQALIRADSRSAKARYRPNQQYQTREVDSHLVHHLKICPWIPDKSGVFQKPQDMMMGDLRADFPYDDRNGLLTAIGFGENARKRSEEYQNRNRDAQDFGFASADEAEEVAKLIKAGVTLEEIRSLAAQQKHTEQPKQSVPDPERRRKNVLANTADAPSKESVLRERFVQIGISEVAPKAKAYLRAKYKNAEGQLICQCCHEEMPFKLRSGEHYFEAVQCISDEDERHYQNRLALCPTCAAMYQYARETDDTELRRRIVEHPADEQADAVEIPVRLASRDHALRFVGTHFFDLKVILKEALRA